MAKKVKVTLGPKIGVQIASKRKDPNTRAQVPATTAPPSQPALRPPNGATNHGVLKGKKPVPLPDPIPAYMDPISE